jgi:putative DNA primase/helicase
MSGVDHPEDGYAIPSGQISYTDEIRAREWWVNWVMAVPYSEEIGGPDFDATATKQPAAPYERGHARPCKWHSGLSDDKHPTTTFEDVIGWKGTKLGLEIKASDRVLSDELGVGIIIPVGGGDSEPITLLDWDDVRDPETKEIHPVCADSLARHDGFAEISQSGEGIHQFVIGEIPGGLKKFIRHIDEEPFIGDERPQIEMYSSGRVVAMTGRHIAGTGDDVEQDQDLIDDLCWEYGLGTNNNEGVPTDPFNRRGNGSNTETPDHDEVGEALRDSIEYDGDNPETWDVPEDEPLHYHAVLRARERSDEFVHISNWELIGYAAAIAHEHDIPREQVIEDLKAHPTPSYGFDAKRAEKETRGVWRKAESGNYNKPSLSTLRERGILPELETEEEDENLSADAEIKSVWKRVQSLYASGDKSDNKEARRKAAQAVTSEVPFLHVIETETLWRYNHDKGYFDKFGDQHLYELLANRLGRFFSISERNEIEARIRAQNGITSSQLDAADADDPLVCVGDGVVNMRTGELRDHDPEYKFTRGIEWDFQPEADSEAVRDFLSDITEREADWKTIVDHLAHGLMPGHPYRAFVMTYGPGGNGKTQLGELLRGFVGAENAAAVEMQEFNSDDFAIGDLPGTMINVGDDVSVDELRDLSTLKSVTGGATARANNKNEKQYDFKNQAAMFFSANEPPRIAEEKKSIDDRLYPISMPYRFVNDPDADDDRQKQKTTAVGEELADDPAAMRGLLSLVIEHGQRVIADDGEYAMPEGPAQRRERYEAASDPILRFVVECLEEGEFEDVILKDDAFTVYAALCDRDDERTVKENTFKQAVSQQVSIDLQNTQTRKLTPGDGRETAWKFVRFNSDTKELMPGRLIDRYFPGSEQAKVDQTESDESDTDDDASEQERATFGAEPIMNAAEATTGYVTVTVEIATTRWLGEDESGLNATLKDESGAIDMVSWNPDVIQPLVNNENDTVVIKNAEVDEFDGNSQLQTVDGLTEVESIQDGVGFTDTISPEEYTGSGSQTGLKESSDTSGMTTDGGEFEGPIGSVANHLRSAREPQSVAQIAAQTGVAPSAVKNAVEQLSSDGKVIERKDGIERND